MAFLNSPGNELFKIALKFFLLKIKGMKMDSKKRQKIRIIMRQSQWCCVTELKVPSSGTSSNFDGTGTELVPFPKRWNLLERNQIPKAKVPVPLNLKKCMKCPSSHHIHVQFFLISYHPALSFLFLRSIIKEKILVTHFFF